MTALSVATRGRAAAERLMVDTIVFTDDDGGTTFDPNTGTYTDTAGTVLYDGPCQVQVTDTVPRDATVGEQQLVVERIIIKIPWDADPVPVNSVGTITAVGEGSGSVVGRRYRVIGSFDKTFGTATKLPCELVST